MKILLFKPGAIGDMLQLSPVVRALKERMPNARIVLMTGGAASAELFSHDPLVDEILVFDRKGEHRPWRAFMKLWAEVRRRRFDLVVNYQRSNLKGWLLLAAAMPCRILVYRKARRRPVHAVENHLEAVAPLGIDPRSADRRLELHLSDDAVRWAGELAAREGAEGRPLVALNPGASHPVNRWPAERFAALAGRLRNELGAAVILVGGPGDRELADAVCGGAGVPIVDLAGRASLLQTAAVLRRCMVVVSGDTGPMHMATAVGTPVVALFGAADPDRTGPVGPGHRVLRALEVPCVPCRSRVCRHTPYLECMDRISVEAVFEAVRETLQTGKGTGSLSR
ncbi:MAG: glycosyltransferase family 9 protein [Thermodesulfobacteriota bacterium]